MVICNNFQVKRTRGADTPPPPPPPSLLAYPLRNKAICSNTNRSRLREREREESMLFIFLYFGPSMQRGIIGLVDEFRSRWIFLGKTLIFIPIVILFETSRRFKITYSLYSNIYIRFSEHEIVHITTFILGPFWGEVSIIHTCAARDKDRPVCTNVITRDECNRRRSIALTPPFFFLSPVRFLSKKFYNIFLLEKFTTCHAAAVHFGSGRNGILWELAYPYRWSRLHSRGTCFVNSRLELIGDCALAVY